MPVISLTFMALASARSAVLRRGVQLGLNARFKLAAVDLVSRDDDDSNTPLRNYFFRIDRHGVRGYDEWTPGEECISTARPAQPIGGASFIFGRNFDRNATMSYVNTESDNRHACAVMGVQQGHAQLPLGATRIAHAPARSPIHTLTDVRTGATTLASQERGALLEAVYPRVPYKGAALVGVALVETAVWVTLWQHAQALVLKDILLFMLSI